MAIHADLCGGHIRARGLFANESERRLGPLYYRGRLVALARPLYYRGGSALVEHPFDRSEESIHEKLEIGAKEMNIGTDVQWAFWDGIRVNNEAMSNAWVM